LTTLQGDVVKEKDAENVYKVVGFVKQRQFATLCYLLDR